MFAKCEFSDDVESLSYRVAGGCRGPGVTCFPDHECLSALSLPCPRNHVNVLPCVAGHVTALQTIFTLMYTPKVFKV